MSQMFLQWTWRSITQNACLGSQIAPVLAAAVCIAQPAAIMAEIHDVCHICSKNLSQTATASLFSLLIDMAPSLQQSSEQQLYILSCHT